MTRTAHAVGAFAATIVLANWTTATFGLVPIGFGLMVTAGTFWAGLSLVARDWVQVTGGKGAALAAVAGGAALSAVVSNPALALASALAFLASELADLAVFTPMRRRSLPVAVVASSVVAAPIDTALFLHLAGFGVTWEAVLGQWIVKTLLALFVALGLHVVSLRRR